MDSKSLVLLSTLFVFCVPLLASAGWPKATHAEIKILDMSPSSGAVTGEIVEIRVDGIPQNSGETVKGDFHVTVLQDGAAMASRVDSAFSMLYPETAPSQQVKYEDVDKLKFKLTTFVDFVVPQGLRPGTATIELSYLGTQKAMAELKILGRPGVAHVVTQMAPSAPPGTGLSALQLERGKQSEIMIRPL